jgi:uncharacterized protein YcfJ
MRAMPHAIIEKTPRRNMTGIFAGAVMVAALGVWLGAGVGTASAVGMGLVAGVVIGALLGRLIVSFVSPDDWDEVQDGKSHVGLRAPDADTA